MNRGSKVPQLTPIESPRSSLNPQSQSQTKMVGRQFHRHNRQFPSSTKSAVMMKNFSNEKLDISPIEHSNSKKFLSRINKLGVAQTQLKGVDSDNLSSLQSGADLPESKVPEIIVSEINNNSRCRKSYDPTTSPPVLGLPDTGRSTRLAS